MNVLKGIVQGLNSANGICEVEVNTDLGLLYSIVLESPGEAEFVKEGKPVRCIFKETDAEILREKVRNINIFEGRLKSIERGSIISKLIIDCGGNLFRFMLTNRQVDRLGLSEGEKVYMLLSPMRVVLEVGNG